MKVPACLSNACSDGAEYLSTQKSLKEAWFNCKRPDWMLWALNEIKYKDDKNFRLFAAKCACDTPLPDGRYTYELLTDKRSRDAIEASIMFAYGKITEEDLAAAQTAARAAAWDAARDAARAATRAATRASTWDAAWDAARDAAWDAAWDAQSDYLRAFIKWEDVEA